MLISRSRVKLSALAGIIVSGLAATAACGGGGGGSATSAQDELRPVTVGLSALKITSHANIVAATLGYYEDEGLDVNLVETAGSSQVAQQLVSGKFDIGQGGADVMMSSISQGADLYFFGSSLRDYRNWIIPANSPIQDIEDLEGTTVGVSDLAGGEVPLLRYVLKEHKLDPGQDVQIVAVGETPATIASAFGQDRIQSFIGAKSGIVPFKLQSGADVRSIMPSLFANSPVEYMTTTAKHKDDKKLLTGFARASAKGALFCRTNPDACLDVIGEDYPELVEDRQAASATLSAYLPLTRPFEGGNESVYWSMSASDLDRYLEIFSAGSDPLITEPGKVDVREHMVSGLTSSINNFDRQKVVEHAKNYTG